MSKLRIVAMASIISLVSAVVFVGTAAAADDLSGTWTMTVQSPTGTGNPVFTLKQEGEKVTGTYKGALGEAPVEGTVKGKDVVLKFKTANPQGELQIEYTGIVEGGTMQGKVKLGQLGEGTFTGKKQ
jgi:hypothetical protein